MKRLILIILLLSNLTFLVAQPPDFVILRDSKGLKSDTVYGEIIFSKNGIVSRAKIMTTEGKKKYSPNKAYGFKYGERYFASVPYTNGRVFAERFINGPIELCYYSSDPKTYSGGLVGALMTAGAVSLTSFYYVKSDQTDDFIRVPNSKKKLIERIAYLFEDNQEIYDKIILGEFKHWELPKIIEDYNAEK